MNILDAVIVILLLVGILGGIKRGLIKEAVLLVGLFGIIILAWYLRVPVATFLYKHLPFFGFNGLFKDVSIINILLYELIAFLAVFAILSIILAVLLKISGIIEKLLKATIILGIFSKIGGAIVGFIEGYIVVFIILFIVKQPFINITGIEDSKLSNLILENTPILSSSTSKTRNAINEIYDVAYAYKKNKTGLNDELIKTFIKYDIITEENVNYLREKGKI